MKKSLCYIILFSMVLHCAARLGVLADLYQHRHQIGQAIGLVVEVPIAMCNSDYHADQLVLQVDDDEHDALPSIIQALEINLFIHAQIISVPATDVKLISHQSPRVAFFTGIHPDSVFHPPSLV